jgi:hypothetical protein
MVKEYIPEHELCIVGSVHEFYNSKENNGKLYLYFPIERL